MRGPLDDYLDVLTGRGRGTGWLELRFRHAEGMRTRFYRAARDRPALVRCALRLAAHRDVYIGCALRKEQFGDRAHVGECWTLWAECDDAGSRDRLARFEIAPSLLVASGSPGHTHAYWALEKPIGADALEDANRRLAGAVDGDPVCFDAARILRPPGTRNHKHAPPRAVRQIGPSAPTPYAIDAILTRLPELPEPSELSGTRQLPDDPLLAIEPKRYVEALLGCTVGRDRKVTCPFHHDRTPSLHVYQTAERGWFCFGCRRGGSIYDLAADLWRVEARGADFRELRERLMRTFSPSS